MGKLESGCWNCKHDLQFPTHPSCTTCLEQAQKRIDRLDGWEAEAID